MGIKKEGFGMHNDRGRPMNPRRQNQFGVHSVPPSPGGTKFRVSLVKNSIELPDTINVLDVNAPDAVIDRVVADWALAVQRNGTRLDSQAFTYITTLVRNARTAAQRAASKKPGADATASKNTNPGYRRDREGRRHTTPTR